MFLSSFFKNNPKPEPNKQKNKHPPQEAHISPTPPPQKPQIFFILVKDLITFDDVYHSFRVTEI